MSVTLAQLNRFAENAGVSPEKTTIKVCGADITSMVALKDRSEEMILMDECEYDPSDFDSTDKILRVWDDIDGENPGFRCCESCLYCIKEATRDSDTGHCEEHMKETDLIDCCDSFRWRNEVW